MDKSPSDPCSDINPIQSISLYIQLNLTSNLFIRVLGFPISRPHIYLSTSLLLYLCTSVPSCLCTAFVYRSIYLSINLSIHGPMDLSIYPSVNVHLSIDRSIHLSIHLSSSIHLSIHPFLHFSVYPSIHLSICPFIQRLAGFCIFQLPFLELSNIQPVPSPGCCKEHLRDFCWPGFTAMRVQGKLGTTQKMKTNENDGYYQVMYICPLHQSYKALHT